MKTVPDNLICDACDAPATVQLLDTTCNIERLYCRSHCPDRTPGRNPGLTMMRYRSPPDNPRSEMLAAAEASEKHQMLREHMCDLKLLGGEGACRYYLSLLTDSDQFVLWNDEFVDNMREFIVTRTDGAAECFSFDSSSVGYMAPFMKREYFKRKRITSKLSKQERAVVLLLQNPMWSDEQIAEHVPTTTKQLSRNLDYVQLKRARRIPI